MTNHLTKYFSFLILFIWNSVLAQNNKLIQVDETNYEEKMQWWTDAKFGMFIHYGLYAQIGYNEWAIEHFNIPFSEYDAYRKTFNPTKFSAEEWTGLAKAAGMKYMVVTTKHHDGFALFDSKYTDWDISNTPFKRDLILELSKQAKKDDIAFGTYYSMLDWHHPDYIPSRTYWDQSLANPKPDSTAYFKYVQHQVSELQDKYDTQILWFDWQKDMRDIPGLSAFWKDMLNKNPKLIINNRLAYTGKMGDYLTPENYIPSGGFQDNNGNAIPFEVCYTMDRSSWGYNPYGTEFLSTRDVIRSLCHVVSKGGNFLLNVGPKPDGSIQQEFIDRLQQVGEWMMVNGESIYGTDAGPIKTPSFYGANTIKGNNLYLQVYSQLKDKTVCIPKLTSNINRISLLGAPQLQVSFTETEKGYSIQIPEIELDKNCFVLKVECDGKPKLLQKERVYDKKESIVLKAYQAEQDRESQGVVQEYDRAVLNVASKEVIKFRFNTDFAQSYRCIVHGVDPPRKKKEFQITMNLDGDEFSTTSQSSIRRKFEDHDLGRIEMQKGKHELEISFYRKEGIEFKFEKLTLIPIIE